VTAVLFTCAGQRVDIVSAFGRAGAFTVAADANPLAPALYHADRHALVPRIDDPAYVDALRRLVAEHDVKLVVPLTDLDQHILAAAELGAVALVPDAEVCESVADKWRAHELFLERGVPTPDGWLPGALPDPVPYPVLVKARVGFGSRNIYFCSSDDELAFHLRHTPVDSFVQAMCAGEEFSIDVFSDLDGRCLNAIPRSMVESKGGESIKGMTVRDDELIAFGARVAETIGIKGPATVQCFRERDGRLLVTDVNPRFGGGFPLPHAAGGRYPELALALAQGERPEPRLGEFREGVVMTRFFSQLTLVAGEDGTLAPFSEEPEPIV
jgi:carbamoyl-phosphate synthase large subunit